MLRWLVGVALIATVALCAACSGGGTPRALPRIHDSKRATVRVTGYLPGLLSRQGLESAIRNFYGRVTRAANDGSIAPIYEATTRTCACRRVAAFIKFARTRGRLSGFRYELKRVYDPTIRSGLGSALVIYSIPEARLVDPKGAVLESEKPVVNATALVTALWQANHWSINAVTSVPRR
jgi:hypothetical protein